MRVYDVARSRLNPGQVVDPHERGKAMRGFPLTRTTSADGRWAYTLYDGAGEHPFIHVLDTGGRTARCIDLDSLTARDLGTPRLRLDRAGSRLVLYNGTKLLALVDTKTFTVSEPDAAPATELGEAAVPTTPSRRRFWVRRASPCWLAAGGLSLRVRRRRRPAAT